MNKHKWGVPSRRHPEPALLPLRAALKGCYSGSNKTISGSSRSNNHSGEIPNQVCNDIYFGFTLIEVLVVVIIIAVLAAIAVPMYQKAVLKSRFSTMIPIVKSIADAQEISYLNSGDYAENFSTLDVSVPGNPTGATATLQDGTQVKLGVEENHIYVRGEKDNNALMIYQKHSPNFAGETHCEAKLDDTLANWLCEKGLDGTFVGKKYGYNIYALDATDPNSTLGRIYLGKNNAVLSDGDKCEATDWNCSHIKADNAQCVSPTRGGCRYGTFTNGAVCKTIDYDSCLWGTYTNGSSCEGVALWTCARDSTFSHDSTCIGKGWQSCYGASFSHHSSCIGEHSSSCYDVTFTDSSYCNAKVSGACKNNAKYDTTSFCVSENGNCPSGTPKGTWDATNETYVLDGWNGGCCDATYMTSGECPSGATVCTQ